MEYQRAARFFEPMYEVMLIARPLRNMFLADHIGCAVRVRDRLIVHHVMDDGSVLQSSWEEFANGKPVRILEREPLDVITLNSRLNTLRQQGPWLYDLILRNCEHYARYLFSGTAISYQIIAAGLHAAIVVGVKVFSK